MGISIKKFQETVFKWYRVFGRHDLPWRKTRDAYRIFVSEIMLHQTQVARVREYYDRFLTHFPTVGDLARAPRDSVVRQWQGLGYNRRAVYLHRAAGEVTERWKGKFPRGTAELESLPGVGPYTARAVRVFAWNKPEVFIETNIRRVFLYHFFRGRRKVDDRA